MSYSLADSFKSVADRFSNHLKRNFDWYAHPVSWVANFGVALALAEKEILFESKDFDRSLEFALVSTAAGGVMGLLGHIASGALLSSKEEQQIEKFTAEWQKFEQNRALRGTKGLLIGTMLGAIITYSSQIYVTSANESSADQEKETTYVLNNEI